MSATIAPSEPEPPSGSDEEEPPSCEAGSRPSAIVVHDPVDPAIVRRVNSLSDEELAGFHFEGRPDPELYAKQHELFVEAVSHHVPSVRYLSDMVTEKASDDLLLGSPNLLFTRDTLITLPGAPGLFIPGRMRADDRVPETQTMRRAIEQLGLRPMFELPDGAVLEGGDVVPFVRDGRRCLVVGYGRRSNWTAVEFLRARLIPNYFDEILAVWLAPWRVTLDGALVAVAEDVIVAQPDSFQSAYLLTQKDMTEVNLLPFLHGSGVRVVEATIAESIEQMACNILCLGDRKIISYDLCERIGALLSDHQIDVRTVPGSELVKSRGGPRCMTCPIYLSESRPARAPLRFKGVRGSGTYRPARKTREALSRAARSSRSASGARKASAPSSPLPRSPAQRSTTESHVRRTH